ncbi:MAG: hypothetical protein HY683_02695 [Chloroflexi bacterium]|nr:hypothetical protein [Chloroflexota bacterium]
MQLGWPGERSAVLVVHGIGQQSPFDALDAFVQGLLATLEGDGKPGAVTARHRVRDFDGRTENYISLLRDGQEATAIDCYEYYWAHETERRISVGEVFDWLVTVGASAQRYYDDMQALADAYEQQGQEAFGRQYVVAGRPRFKKYWYLKNLGFALSMSRVLMTLLDPLASRFPVVMKPVKLGVSLVGAVAKPFIVGSVGDVAIYTTMDMKSKHYEVRQRILNGSVKKLSWLLTSQGKGGPAYGRVVLAGHSLGSVVAYDSLNRINNAINIGLLEPGLAGKLRGLVTFGSPLDKIAFFFDERSPRSQYLKKQLLAQYHSFKRRPAYPNWTPPRTLHPDIRRYLDGTRWLNFWARRDPVSGPLDFYEIPKGDNRELPLDGRWGSAHSQYWAHQQMYHEIVRDLLAG